MPCIFTVAAYTGSNDLGMIHGNHRCPHRGAVTGITYVGTRYMPCIFAVTARTGSQHLRMVHRNYRNPCSSGMACFTHSCAADMPCVFTRRHSAVMTTETGTNHMCVVHRGNVWQPGVARRCSMTGFAHVSRTWVRCWLTCSSRTVVATGAGADDLRMIHGTCSYRCPVRREFLVAGITQIC